MIIGVDFLIDFHLYVNHHLTYPLPNFPHPNTQITDLTSSDFTNQEGILYARILRDRLSPNTTGTADQKLNTGDVVLSQIPQIMTEFQSYESIIYVNFVDVGFNLSRGQNFILGNQ